MDFTTIFGLIIIVGVITCGFTGCNLDEATIEYEECLQGTADEFCEGRCEAQVIAPDFAWDWKLYVFKATDLDTKEVKEYGFTKEEMINCTSEDYVWKLE